MSGSPLTAILLERIEAEGPLTIAAYMEAALYHPTDGYYAAASQRSGRGGDFYTSVDAGPLFGECLAELTVRAWRALRRAGGGEAFDLVEVGAGNGRLMRDLLDAVQRRAPEGYAAVRVTLVERSHVARAAQAGTLGPHVAKLQGSLSELPLAFTGLLIANELLDAVPVHRVVAVPGGLREVYVGAADGQLVLEPGPLSTPDLRAYFDRLGLSLPVGTVADISLAAVAWARQAARALQRGYLALIDYGHDAPRLFGAGDASGTLRAYRRHLVDPSPDSRSRPAWLVEPGTSDLTAHVDFTTIANTLGDEGLHVLPRLDQTQWLLRLGLADLLAAPSPDERTRIARLLAARTLVVPGGLGSTHSALVAARGTADPALELGLARAAFPA